MRTTAFIGLLALLHGTVCSQSTPEDSTTDRVQGKGQFLILPALGYTPETRFLGGAVAGYFWKSQDTLRKSSLTGQLIYTQNDQVQGGVSFEIFSDSGRSKVTGETMYSYWPGKFFGLGNKTPAQAEEPFTEKFLRSMVGIYFSVGPGLSLGPEFELRVSKVVGTARAGALESGNVGGVERYVASGIGVGALLDTRDDNFVPGMGRSVYLSGRWFSGAFGSDYTFARYTLDAREYVPLYGDHVLGVQAYLCAISGSAPFQMLSLLGGEQRGRGYYEGRYRDNVLIACQAEYRSPLVFRCGLVLFGGITQVARNLSGLALGEIHPYVGFGIRFRLLKDTRVNLRFDWGYGDDSSGNYIGVNEAF